MWFSRIVESGKRRSSSNQSEDESESDDDSPETKCLLYFIHLPIYYITDIILFKELKLLTYLTVEQQTFYFILTIYFSCKRGFRKKKKRTL